MARKAAGDRRRRVVDRLGKMLVQYLNIHAFKGLPLEDMAKRIGISYHIVNLPWWTDIPEICEAAGLDIGLAIRDSKGNEVTLWPSENFSSGPQLNKSATKKLGPQGPKPPVAAEYLVEAGHKTLGRFGRG